MTDVTPPGGRDNGDGWTACTCGRRHWGLHGAAGLLLVRWQPTDEHDGARDDEPDGAATPRLQVLLQHRALWSDQGDTWGVPGGALRPDEDPVAGALREAAEEAGVDPAGVAVVGTHVLDHTAWSYTTVIARVSGPQDPHPADAESLEVRWVNLERVTDFPLLLAFGDAWPTLRDLLPGGPGQ